MRLVHVRLVVCGAHMMQVSELVASMPFELRALEACLEHSALLMEGQADELAAAAHIALDELMLKVRHGAAVGRGGAGSCTHCGACL